ncbi:hypothetical protein FA04_03020 [Ensifer adhaerens]|uniref:PAN domain-containing protein n=1 Tax=Ensifer adhaerens TaxID=106592 RepID=A0ABY8HGW7_ENSAD|nr:PAN domain-containing protein [Ensifer adhaerens]ANK71694.1 hypothetical protein FA04_03020 [Ensifer adhaerens]KDP71580.1 hypothetical protein FA04_22170 [Ensifer adhaerens]WFP91371.1 PAN domain-containing protein [Ensifer adhaerens]
MRVINVGAKRGFVSWYVSAGIATLWLAVTPFAFAQDGTTAAELFNYPNTAINGINSAELPKPLEECRKICAARTGCVGFDYSEKGVCRIFASIGSVREAPGSTSETRAVVAGFRDPTNPPLEGLFEKLKQSDHDGDELLDLSRKAFDRGKRDIGNQAIQLSMQRGNTDAKLEVAQWYDPRTFAADRVPSMDANKAARSYFELALEGNSKAVTLLTSMCQEASNTGSIYTNAFESFLGSTYCEGSLNP